MNNENSYFKFHENEDKKPHDFLSEELLVPRTSNCDTQRLNMWANHLNQLVHLRDPEYPKVFTNFEDQVGEYSIAYKTAKEDFDVIKKIVKNPYNYDLVVRYKESGIYDIIHYHAGVNTTETYGYKMTDEIPDIKDGDEVKKGTVLSKSSTYDEELNFKYGVNLKVAYGCWFGKTYEDGVVISDSAAKKLTSYKVETTMFSVNTNDILINLYGDKETYKSFPRVGDKVDGHVLVAMRRKDKYSILYDFQTANLSKIDPTNDDIIYTIGGTVSDINIYSNISADDLESRGDEFSLEIAEVLRNQDRYWKEIKDTLEQIIPKRQLTAAEERYEKDLYGFTIEHPISAKDNENKYTDELAYYWKLSHETLNKNILWRYDKKAFDNFKIEFQLIKENPLVPGSKISGRYGNKGIISEIKPDSEMPTTESGMRADVCLNALGVINRLNLAQIQEVHINFMSDHVIEIMKTLGSNQEKFNLLHEYVSRLNKDEAEFMKKEFEFYTDKEKTKFLNEIIKNGIPIHQPPFFGNTSFEEFKQIYKDHPEWVSLYKMKGIDKDLVIGDLYFIRLKHEPFNKSSMRSATNLNTKNIPAKSTAKRDKKSLYSTNPLRLGEMETNNLLLTKDGKKVSKFLKCYSTNEEARQETIMSLLCPQEDELGNKVDSFDSDLNVHEGTPIAREILNKYLNLLELNLLDNDDEEE